MPSVFPGMDPFIEGQEWEDFHHHFIEDIYNALVAQVRPQYVVRVEKRVYVEHQTEEWPGHVRPDVTVAADEFDPDKGWISVDSPMAMALLKHAIDDEISVPTPQGERRYYIVAVRYAE